MPHSIDNKNKKVCDLELCKKLYNRLENKRNVFLLADYSLDYAELRAIIGLFDFYITGRYHSLASALSMGVPVIPLSWHVKYKDITNFFLDDYPEINCKDYNENEALALIKKYYSNQDWFDRNRISAKKTEAIKQIEKSIKLVVEEIIKYKHGK